MTGTHTQNPVYSRITLALMEDTGWYSANYTMAQELGWGRKLGCDFAMKSCKEWIVAKSSKFSYVQILHLRLNARVTLHLISLKSKLFSTNSILYSCTNIPETFHFSRRYAGEITM